MTTLQQVDTLHGLLEASLPHASIVVMDTLNTIILGDRNAQSNTFTFSGKRESTTVTVDGEPYSKIGIPLLDTYQIWISVPLVYYPDLSTIFRMVDRMVAAVFVDTSISVLHRRNHHNELQIFFDQIFHSGDTNQHIYTSLLAANLGIDLSVPRMACIIEFPDNTPAEHMRISAEHLTTLRQGSMQDIIGSFGTLLIYFLNTNVATYNRKVFETEIESVQRALSSLSGSMVRIAIDGFVETLSDYTQSFSTIHDILHLPSTKSKTILFSEDFLFERIILYSEKEQLDHYFAPSLTLLKDAPHLLQTIEALVTNNMDLFAAATTLKVHRNTVVFRLKHISSILGLNPIHNDNDRLALHLLYHYYLSKQ